MAQTYPSCLSPERMHSHLLFLADLPIQMDFTSPKQSMPLQAFGVRNGTYLPSPNENVFAIPCVHWNPRYEFGWDELHLAREPQEIQEPGPPPVL